MELKNIRFDNVIWMEESKANALGLPTKLTKQQATSFNFEPIIKLLNHARKFG